MVGIDSAQSQIIGNPRHTFARGRRVARMIAGKACIGPALAISTEREWASLRPEHLVADAALPYKTIYGFTISQPPATWDLLCAPARGDWDSEIPS